jgi:hypothetical protein
MLVPASLHPLPPPLLRAHQVLKAFELTVVAQEGSARAQNGISEKSTRVDRDLITPMKVRAC